MIHRRFPRIFVSLLLAAAAASAARGDDAAPVAQDDATKEAYGSGWTDGSNGGSGFNAWSFKTLTGSGNSNAGFYIATATDNPDSKGVDQDGKAFGLYANGVNFEAASAFRALSTPLAVGQSVVVSWQTGDFEKKFDTDSGGTGSVGFTLRTGDQANAIDDYNNGARFEFGVYSGTPNYQIYDGQDDHDTGVPFNDEGVKVKLTLTGTDTYNLDITTLADQKTTTLTGRKLAGTAGGSIDSLCIFDRNWEKNDAYFNDIEVLPAGAAAAAPSAAPSAAAAGSAAPAASPSAAATSPLPVPGVTPAGL
jgi:hypothetical protein